MTTIYHMVCTICNEKIRYGQKWTTVKDAGGNWLTVHVDCEREQRRQERQQHD